MLARGQPSSPVIGLKALERLPAGRARVARPPALRTPAISEAIASHVALSIGQGKSICDADVHCGPPGSQCLIKIHKPPRGVTLMHSKLAHGRSVDRRRHDELEQLGPTIYDLPAQLIPRAKGNTQFRQHQSFCFTLVHGHAGSDYRARNRAP